MNQPPKQPKVTARTRVETPGYYGQELPDPEGHLSEEQKTWPVVTELLPVRGGASVPVVEPGLPEPKAQVAG